jgi:hypothetical protein
MEHDEYDFREYELYKAMRYFARVVKDKDKFMELVEAHTLDVCKEEYYQ